MFAHVLVKGRGTASWLQMWWSAGGRCDLTGHSLAAPGDTACHPLGLPSFPQIAKQSLRPFCTVCNRYFKTPRKFVEHVKSQGHKDKAKEVTPAPSQDMGPERYRALARATQQFEVFPSLNSYQVWRDWDAQSCGAGGVGRFGCPELT